MRSSATMRRRCGRLGYVIAFITGCFLFSLAKLVIVSVDPAIYKESANGEWLKLRDSLLRLKQDQNFELHDDIPPLNRTPGYSWIDEKYLSLQNNVYLEQFGLHYCKMDKNMGSAMQAIMCYLDNPQEMEEFFFDKAWGPGLGRTNCGRSTSFGELRIRFLKAAENWDFFSSDSDILHFAITRDPISRFISAFLNVCRQKPDPNLCFNCGRDLDCFVPKLYYHLRNHAEHMPLERWNREWHFYPQSWYCDFDRRIGDYKLLRYARNERFFDELLNVFRSGGVNQTYLTDVENALKRKQAKHATYNIAPMYHKQLRASNFLLEFIYKAYYLDFLWFGYDLHGELDD